MSVHVSSLVWKFEGLTAPQKLVLLKLADTANDEGESAYPAVSTIERESSLSERTVRECLKWLRDNDLLLPEGRHNRRRTVIYRINLEVLRNSHMKVQEAQGAPAAWCASRTHMGAPAAPKSSFNHPISPLPPLNDFADEYRGLFNKWVPVDQKGKGDFDFGLEQYRRWRLEGDTFEEIRHCMSEYLQFCHAKNVRTYFIGNWLAKRDWRKGSPGGANGKAGAKRAKPEPVARLFVAIDGLGLEVAKWTPEKVPSAADLRRDYPSCTVRIRDMRPDEFNTAKGENDDQNKITA